MSLIELLTWIILSLPLAAFVIQMAIGYWLPRQGDWLSSGAIGLSLIFSAVLCYRVLILEYDPHFLWQVSYPWFSAGGIDFTFGLYIDNLACVMLLVVALVSTLVHVFSMGYMEGERYYHRYYAYLSLFSVSMLALVSVDNLFLLYITWELVGVSSYLLIGFFWWKHSAADACKKAFLTTRVGDIFMFIGILLLVAYTGKLGYTEVFESVAHGEIAGWLLIVTSLCLFGGAVGKSAQFPLHIWLPDAMEGPTPVSALIHAATMVAAGVYMVGRLFPVFSAEPAVMLTIAYIGLITAFFAATVAITQTDIKRVLAYSTISQLGYMFTALGVGAYTAGLYHLMTHAFFKALLFLGSGSVIHAVHTQEMPKMGGLRHKMPITFITMLAATLAISGVPLFSGFGSKDAILMGALEYGVDHPAHIFIFIGLLLGAGITAFYMFRLMFLTFFGEPRDPEKHEHAHESPPSMTVPLIALGVLSVIGGLGLYGELWFNHLIVPTSVEAAHGGHGAAHAHHPPAWIHYSAMAMSIGVAALGIFCSWLMYMKNWPSPGFLARALKPLYVLSYRKYYVDELYGVTFIGFVMVMRKVAAWFDRVVVDGIVNLTAPMLRGTAHVSGGTDRYVVDGFLNFLALVVQAVGTVSTLLQSGVIQNYVWKVSVALVIILLIHNYLLRLIGL